MLGRRVTTEYLVHLRHHRIQNFSFEWPKHDRLIFNWIDDETLPRLNDTRTNVIDCRHRNDKTIFAGTRALYFCVQFLSHGFHQLRPKVFWMQ